MPALLAGPVDGDDVGVVDRGGDARLALEALAEAGVAGPLRRDQLDRDGAAERELRRAVDDAHATATGDRLDAATGDLGAWEEIGHASDCDAGGRWVASRMQTTTLGPLTVCRLCLGTMLMGDKTPADEAHRMLDRVPRRRRHLRRHGRHLRRRRLGGDARAVARAPARRGRAGDEGPLPGLRPGRRGARARPHRARLRREPAAAGHRRHRPLPGPRARSRRAAGGRRSRRSTGWSAPARCARWAPRTSRPGCSPGRSRCRTARAGRRSSRCSRSTRSSSARSRSRSCRSAAPPGSA